MMLLSVWSLLISHIQLTSINYTIKATVSLQWFWSLLIAVTTSPDDRAHHKFLTTTKKSHKYPGRIFPFSETSQSSTTPLFLSNLMSILCLSSNILQNKPLVPATLVKLQSFSTILPKTNGQVYQNYTSFLVTISVSVCISTVMIKHLNENQLREEIVYSTYIFWITVCWWKTREELKHVRKLGVKAEAETMDGCCLHACSLKFSKPPFIESSTTCQECLQTKWSRPYSINY